MLKKLSKFIVPALLSLYTSAQACDLSYGISMPQDERAAYIKAWPTSELHDALTKGSGCGVTLRMFSSERGLYDAVLQKKVDFANLKDFAYYLAQRKDPTLKPLAVMLTKGLGSPEPSAYYNSYLITLSNSDINTIQDLHGKKIGSKDKTSASGHIVPEVFLEQNHVKVKHEFIHTQQKLFDLLYAKKVDAIATWDWVVNHHQGDASLRILKTFQQLPNPPIIVTHSLPSLDALQNALVQARVKDGSVAVQGYGPVQPHMYDATFKIFDQYCAAHKKECAW